MLISGLSQEFLILAEVVLMVGGVDIQSFELLEGRAMIGRSTRAHICLSDDTVSAKHAVIEMIRDSHEASNCQFYLQDLCSTNGTRLASQDVRRALLRDGDVIQVGWQQLRFASPEV